LRATLTEREFREWLAFYSLAPFGPERGDLQAARVCQTLASVWTAKGATPPSLTDFLLFKEEESDEDKAEALAAKVRSLQAVLGGVLINGDDDT